MKIIITLTLVLWFICAGAANASPTLNIYYVRSNDSIPLPYVTYMNLEIKRRFKEEFKTKIKIRIRGVKNSNIPYVYDSTLKHFSYWYARISKRSTRRHWALVLMPPVYKDGGRWLVGAGQSTCFNKRKRVTLAISVAESVNSSGQDRLIHSVMAAMHELGHTLGLNHRDSLPPTIMHSGVLYYSSYGMGFDNEQRSTGKNCLRNNR